MKDPVLISIFVKTMFLGRAPTEGFRVVCRQAGSNSVTSTSAVIRAQSARSQGGSHLPLAEYTAMLHWMTDIFSGTFAWRGDTLFGKEEESRRTRKRLPGTQVLAHRLSRGLRCSLS